MKRHLKKLVLQLMADGRPYCAAAVAQNIGAIPRSMNSYVRRLERQGLVSSSLAGRILVFVISPKGRERLRWFETHPRYDFLRRR